MCYNILFLVSCSINRVSKEEELKVIKSGRLISNSNYFVEYDNAFKDSLIYKDFYKIINNKLNNIGFNTVNSIEKANYIIKFSFNKVTPKFSNNNYTDVNNENNLSTEILNKIYNDNKKFILQAYKINKDKSYEKILEAYTKEVVTTRDVLEREDLGSVRFISCSIDSILDDKLNNNQLYKEYYYKCL